MNAEDPDFIRTARASYDAMAPDYAAHVPDGLAARPVDRALVTAFGDLVRAQGTAPVADLGCGPGHVTARLDALGVPVFGVDLSPRMVALARRTHPGLRFHVGTMTALDLPPETLGGIAALYSVTHVPREHLPALFAEFRRVLVPGGHALVAFRTGDDDHQHLTERFGHELALDCYWYGAATISTLLAEAGLHPRARTLLEPEGDGKRQRAFLLARKPPREG
ncbi:class I SAM-dependent methyltransferase [Streptomyces sp. TP-A0356]|uniref:class I SAM-dependent DNA methyltransferase n=1 Tax=Streptomyces sp. TP-A0356 TaxID=1359208 RepID=UPI0006E12B07|nr:class I SAM-dependent methyltransferase [Streptomyces sp. TP-A0356]